MAAQIAPSAKTLWTVNKLSRWNYDTNVIFTKHGAQRQPHDVRTLRNTVPVIPNTVPIWLSMFSICMKAPLPLKHNKMSLNHRAANVMWEQM